MNRKEKLTVIKGMWSKHKGVERLFSARGAEGKDLNIPIYILHCIKAVICIAIGKVKETIPTSWNTYIVSRYTFDKWEDVSYHSNGDLCRRDAGCNWQEMVVGKGLWKGWMVYVYENGV